MVHSIICFKITNFSTYLTTVISYNNILFSSHVAFHTYVQINIFDSANNSLMKKNPISTIFFRNAYAEQLTIPKLIFYLFKLISLVMLDIIL